MGKKKGYYVSELYFKPEENTNIEKPESFTVKDYDAIANEVRNELPSKQLNAYPKKGEIDNDISSDVQQTDTQDIENDVVNEQPIQQLNTDPKKEEKDGNISKDVHKTDKQDIVNDVANEQPIKQMNMDPKKDGVDGDISSDSLPTDTKDVLPLANEVVNDQPCEQLNEDPVKDEIDDDNNSSSDSYQTDTQAVISDTNAIEPVSYKKLNDAEDDNQLKKDANSQSTAIIDDAKSNLDTGASKKQASANESSNLKAAEKFTSIELGEIKHAPKNSPAINWFKRNRFFVIGIIIIVVLITVISIAASSRKKPISTGINEIPLSSTTEFAGPRKATLPPGVYPATDVIDNTEDFNNTKTSSIAPSLEPTTNETTTEEGINGNTIAASDSTSTTDVSSTPATTDEYDYAESSGDGGDDSLTASLLFEND